MKTTKIIQICDNACLYSTLYHTIILYEPLPSYPLTNFNHCGQYNRRKWPHLTTIRINVRLGYSSNDSYSSEMWYPLTTFNHCGSYSIMPAYIPHYHISVLSLLSSFVCYNVMSRDPLQCFICNIIVWIL